jgi:serine protease AprX
MARTVIAIPLLDAMKAAERDGKPDTIFDVIIEYHNACPGGPKAARRRTLDLVTTALMARADTATRSRTQESPVYRRHASDNYLFASLTASQIQALVRLDNGWGKAGHERRQGARRPRAIYRIWLDHDVEPLLTKSVVTVKGDAARVAFAAEGHDIVWAVVDSGIDGTHPHFQLHRNLDLPAPVVHRDFTDASQQEQPLVDEAGHGTHVAGIIAGELRGPASAHAQALDEQGRPVARNEEFHHICGVAPKAKLVSYKVLHFSGGRAAGKVSHVIEALQAIQQLNEHGRHLRIHGVNLSVGYEYRAEWFACGQSPMCAEVNRLVRGGVVVVVAAGNTGYGTVDAVERTTQLSIPMSINDPGNAELALTIGATHRDSPHLYGVSYFSSKGPTGDGRLKPDLLAPGERIISARSALAPQPPDGSEPRHYEERSGTSMAAPHVSGAAAAFLSIRREFIGQPERVKEILMASATDLRRERYLQGHGLLDVMRAIQSV